MNGPSPEPVWVALAGPAVNVAIAADQATVALQFGAGVRELHHLVAVFVHQVGDGLAWSSA